jgi:hypothetical protein
MTSGPELAGAVVEIPGAPITVGLYLSRLNQCEENDQEHARRALGLGSRLNVSAGNVCIVTKGRTSDMPSEEG